MCFELPSISRVQEMGGSSISVRGILLYEGIFSKILSRRLQTLQNHIAIKVVVFVVLGYLYVVIDKKLGEKIKKAEN